MSKTAKLGEHKYFNFYTSQDATPFLNEITALKGAAGYIIFNELYRLILGGNYGYFVENNKQMVLELHRRCAGTNLKIDEINEVLQSLLDIGVFDNEIHSKLGILTSKELQMMHLDAGARRLENYIYKEHFLLNEDDLSNLKRRREAITFGDKILFIDKRENQNENDNILDKKVNNNEINVSNKEINDNIYSLTDNINEQTHARTHVSILNKTKENYTKENTSKVSVNDYSLVTDCVKSESKPTYDFQIDEITYAFVSRGVIPSDSVSVMEINKVILFKVNRYGRDIVNSAAYSVMKTLKYAKDIKDYRLYISKALKVAIDQVIDNLEEQKQKEVEEQLVDNNNAVAEVEQLRKAYIEKQKRKEEGENDMDNQSDTNSINSD